MALCSDFNGDGCGGWTLELPELGPDGTVNGEDLIAEFGVLVAVGRFEGVDKDILVDVADIVVAEAP